jgi:cell division protein FtsW (lipid II flippase)
MALPAIALTVLALIAVLLVGTVTFGARRTLFGGSLQPSEPAKIIILMYGAAWLASRRKQVTSISIGLFPFVVIIGSMVALIAAEPDLSTSVIILLAASAMFFMAGASVIQIVLVGGAAAGFAYLMVTVFQHVSNRLTEFANGYESVYQIKRALIAIGSGGIFGNGIGLSYQKFGLLPAQNTDSVIAVVAEEMGLIGVALVLGLLAVLAYRALRIAQRADTTFGAFWAVGLVTWIMSQALLNLLANNGLIPLPGVPVPFISYGGSSLISVLAASGILISISRGTKMMSNSADSDDDGEEVPGGGNNEKVASTTIRRRDSGSRSARTNRSKQIEDDRSTEIIGRDVKFRPRLGRGSDTTGSSGSIRWRNGRYGTGTRYPRGR